MLLDGSFFLFLFIILGGCFLRSCIFRRTTGGIEPPAMLFTAGFAPAIRFCGWYLAAGLNLMYGLSLLSGGSASSSFELLICFLCSLIIFLFFDAIAARNRCAVPMLLLIAMVFAFVMRSSSALFTSNASNNW